MGEDIQYGIHKYYKSFSGTDTIAFILMPGSVPICIGSLTTISYSMFRNKKPVINIGRTNINGVTRGSRIFAGTMIFTLINQHWLRELQGQLDWLKPFEELKVDELPLFDIMIVSANEYGNWVSMYIYGIDFTDEAQTISVEDLFTENTFSFVARDISTFRAHNALNDNSKKSSPSKHSKDNKNLQKFFILDSSTTDIKDIMNLEKEFVLSTIKTNYENLKNMFGVIEWSRDLYFNPAKFIMGNDVSKLQVLLNNIKLFPQIEVNGVFDKNTETLVKKFQSLIVGGIVDGIVSKKFMLALKEFEKAGAKRFGVIVNKAGALVHKLMSLDSDIVSTKSFNEIIDILNEEESEDDYGQKWYKTSEGYILKSDVFDAFSNGNVIELPILKNGDENDYVKILQNALSKIFENVPQTGIFNDATEEIIKRIQLEHGLEVNGKVDNSTWLLIQSLSGSILNTLSDDGFNIDFSMPPGVYDMDFSNINAILDKFKTTITSITKSINTKVSTIIKYKDDKFKTISKVININKNDKTEIPFADFKQAFLYNNELGRNPAQIDFVIYPYNKTPYKWTFNYKKEGEKDG